MSTATATASTKATDKTTATKPKAAEEEQDTETPAPQAAGDNRNRVNYKPDIKGDFLVVSYGPEHMTLDAGKEIMQHEGVRDHLAYLGLITYLQRESSKARDIQKLDAIDVAYAEIADKGMKAFERKSNAPTGPKKADKVAALAMLKNRTPDAIRDALKKLPQAKQDELLNHPKVLEKVAELKAGDEKDLSI